MAALAGATALVLTAFSANIVFFFSPSDLKTVYLGTNGSGLYRSRDGGTTWAPLPLTLK